MLAGSATCTVILDGSATCTVILDGCATCTVMLDGSATCTVILDGSATCTVILDGCATCTVMLDGSATCTVMIVACSPTYYLKCSPPICTSTVMGHQICSTAGIHRIIYLLTREALLKYTTGSLFKR